jgi:hypothetical protein
MILTKKVQKYSISNNGLDASYDQNFKEVNILDKSGKKVVSYLISREVFTYDYQSSRSITLNNLNNLHLLDLYTLF